MPVIDSQNNTVRRVDLPATPVTAAPPTVSGAAAIVVSANVSALQPLTTYYYRTVTGDSVATEQSFFTVSGVFICFSLVWVWFIQLMLLSVAPCSAPTNLTPTMIFTTAPAAISIAGTYLTASDKLKIVVSTATCVVAASGAATVSNVAVQAAVLTATVALSTAGFYRVCWQYKGTGPYYAVGGVANILLQGTERAEVVCRACSVSHFCGHQATARRATCC